jgi:DNA-binding NarL/FixJ family response regulator
MPRSTASRRTVGLLALAPSGKILYRNAEAHRFCVQLAMAEGRTPRRLPQAIESAVAGLPDKSARSGEAVRVPVGAYNGALVLRPFLIASTSTHTPLIIVQIEPWTEAGAELSDHGSEMRFTGREQEVLACLTTGFTNKEIGTALGISETTVKVHVRRIMMASQNSTRMRLVASVLDRRSEPSR